MNNRVTWLTAAASWPVPKCSQSSTVTHFSWASVCLKPHGPSLGLAIQLSFYQPPSSPSAWLLFTWEGAKLIASLLHFQA
eukprot:359163-Chlamydomonas_euryale.AAC.8